MRSETGNHVKRSIDYRTLRGWTSNVAQDWSGWAEAVLDGVGEWLFPSGSAQGLRPALVSAYPIDGTRDTLRAFLMAAVKGDKDGSSGDGADNKDRGRSDGKDDAEKDGDEDPEDEEESDGKKKGDEKIKEAENRALSRVRQTLTKLGVLPKGKKIEDLGTIIKAEREEREKLQERLEELEALGGKPKKKGAKGDDDPDEDEDEAEDKSKDKAGDSISMSQAKKLVETRLARLTERHKKELAARDEHTRELQEVIDVHIVGGSFKAIAAELDMAPELTATVLMSRSRKVKEAFPYVVKPDPEEPGEVILYEEDGETAATDAKGNRLTLRKAMAELKGDPAFEDLQRTKVGPGSGGDRDGKDKSKATKKGDAGGKETRVLRGAERINKAVSKWFPGKRKAG